MTMRRACLLLLVTALVAVLGIVPAHANGSGHSHHEPSTGPAAMLLLGAVALGLAGASRWRRPAALVVLSVLVALFGVESAVHSAHHLADSQGAASCAFSAASQHDESAGAAAAVTVTVTRTIEHSPSRKVVEIRPFQAFHAHQDRAPPVLPSA
jgi:hypothetical protein